MKKRTCASCGAEIFFGITAAGKAMPLDAQVERRAVVTGTRGESPVIEIRETYRSHFATCPNAECKEKTE